ncbi:MAG: YggS family pyridoxal phosphate-dependent enzyme [Micrococcales bacterium]|nr:YggS family pyridoxal phosphate-dependent enzyme [Micrococcales bacterium]
MTDPSDSPDRAARREQLRVGLQQVHDRIERASAAAGRDPDEAGLVVVTKYFPASDVELLHGLGVRDIGENKDQEAAAKVSDLAPGTRAELRVHFIGQIQSKKCGSIARYADVVQSLDRPKLVGALDRGAATAGRQVEVLIQISLDGAAGRGGVPIEGAQALADAVGEAGHLRLRGVMAVAPLGGDPDEAFGRLGEVARGIRADHPEATWVSAGMSGDLEAAVRHGATHLRVGTAILGTRPSLG